MPYRLLASDYDNTLVPLGEGCPRPAVAAAVRRMQAQGVPFVLCTGRCLAALATAPGLLKGVAYDYAVCANGGQVVDKAGNTLFETPITSEEMYALVDFCEDYDYPMEFAFSDGYYAYVEYEGIRRFYAGRKQAGLAVFDGEDQDRHRSEMPTAAFVMFPMDGLARFREKYGYLGLEFILLGEQDGELYYDVMHAGTDKASGLKGLCAALDIPLSEVVAAGDGPNDIGMLKAAGLGCAMGNAGAEAKAAAARVIGDVKQDGLAELIDTLWPPQ